MDIFLTLYRLHIIPFLKKWNLLNLILGSIDIFAITMAFQCSYWLYFDDQGGYFFYDKTFLKLFSWILPLWLLILYFIKVAEIPRTRRYRVLFLQYLQGSVILFFLLTLGYVVFRLFHIPRLFLTELTIIGFLFLFIFRLLEYKIFKSYRARGYNRINVVLIADDTSESFIESLLTNKEWGYRIFAIFTESAFIQKQYEKTIIILPGKFVKVLHDLMEVDLIDEVLYLKNKVNPAEVREMIRSCEELGVTFKLKLKENNIKLTNALKSEIADEKFLTFINVPHNPYSLALKKIMDVFVSLVVILLLSPVLLFIAAAIKFTSRGPVIFKQARVGLRGRQFYLYKFRTMVANAEAIRKELGDKNESDGPAFKMKDDPRVTKIGKFLRKSGLDELPQLFNVLKGEMSLIGPRPPLQSETLQYKRWQLRRLSVKPGLSCFWQIKPERNNIRFDKWMELDLAYIDNWSLRLDLIILLKTVGTVFKRTGL
jgi:exopolysaccharide biosynthesis polyprenyl glycosylphosphotransferase